MILRLTRFTFPSTCCTSFTNKNCHSTKSHIESGPGNCTFDLKSKSNNLNLNLMKHSFVIFRNLSILLLSFTLILGACSKNSHDDSSAQQSAFAGKYLVVTSSETFTLQIDNSGGSNFKIKEFGGFLNVPLNAVLEGNSLKIPSQTFTNAGSGKSITVTGTGILLTKGKKDDTIRFDYKVTGFTNYESDFEGTRK